MSLFPLWPWWNRFNIHEETLYAGLHLKGEFFLPFASSGITSLLLPIGRTAHPRFGILLTVNSELMCRGLHLGSELAD